MPRARRPPAAPPPPARPLPRYPVFVLSKGRWQNPMTVKFLLRDEVPFRLVVEPSEEAAYREAIPAAPLLVAPRDNMGATGVRCFIREVAIEEGWERHWQLDDNMADVRRLYRGKRIPCNSGVAFRVCEDFTDRYTNIGVSGLNYQMFVTDETPVPFYLNCHVYSCVLVWNRMPYRWRLPLNDDTDLCLQVLSAGLCTVNINVFHVDKMQTMKMSGGQGVLYHGDGRLRMAKTLERAWPYVVQTHRRFQRPQHVVRDGWRGFDQPLIRRTDIDWDALPAVDEYGMVLEQRAAEIRSPLVRALVDAWAESGGEITASRS
jgi:TET-Associated Glycosyltransferase